MLYLQLTAVLQFPLCQDESTSTRVDLATATAALANRREISNTEVRIGNGSGTAVLVEYLLGYQ